MKDNDGAVFGKVSPLIADEARLAKIGMMKPV
jgi:hypothetical protein